MITNFDHIHLYTANLPDTLHFYEHVLGAEPVGALVNNHGGQNHLLLLAGQFLAISTYPDGISPQEPPSHGDGALTHGFGVAHLGVNVRELQPLIDRLQSAGVTVHDPPRGAGAVRYVYFTAPDGVVIELTEYVVPDRLRPAVAALHAFNRAIHAARRVVGKALIDSATAQ